MAIWRAGDGQLYVWDVASRKCLTRHDDVGCVHGTALAVSSDGNYYATGYAFAWFCLPSTGITSLIRDSARAAMLQVGQRCGELVPDLQSLAGEPATSQGVLPASFMRPSCSLALLVSPRC